jgi:drug/metabolite transporter (DMT)-like permease
VPDACSVARSSHVQGALLLIAAAACLSASGVLISASEVAPITAGALRVGLALVVLAPLALVEWRRRGPMPRRALACGAMAGVALGIDFSCWNVSVVEAGAGVASVLINVQVIGLPALLWVLDRAPIPRRLWLIAPVMLVGVALAGGVLRSGGHGPAAHGVLLGLAAGMAYACYLYAIRRGAPDADRWPIGVLTVACAVAAATAACIAVLTGDASVPGTARAWLMMAMLALLGQVAAFALINRGTARLTPDVAGPLLLLPTVFAVPMAAVALDEIPTVTQVVGCLVVLGATWYATRQGSPGRGDPRPREARS